MNSPEKRSLASGLAGALFCFLAAASWTCCCAAQNDSATPGKAADTIAPVSHEHDVGDLVKIGSSAVLREGETCKDAVVIGGTADIRGHVRGDLVVIMGSASVNSVVDGDLVLVGANGKLGPKTEVHGQVIAVGGKAVMPDGVVIDKGKVEIAPALGDLMMGVQNYLERCVFKGRFAAPEILWTLFLMLGIAALGFLLSALFRETFAEALKLTEMRPGIVLIVGILAIVALGPVILAFISTVLGIPLIPVLCMLLLGLSLIGCTAVNGLVGGRICGIFRGAKPPVAVPVAIGSVLVMALATAPFIGMIVVLFAFTMGTGAGILAFFEKIRRPRTAAVVPPVATGEANTSTAPQPAIAPSRVAVSAPVSEQEAPAGMFTRMVAALIDILLVWCVYSLTFGNLLHASMPAFEHQDHLAFALLLVYLAVMWAWKGTTIGSIVFHLQVRRMDDTRPTVGVAVIRALGLILALIPLGIGFFWIRWDAQHQGWHDKIAGTKVVKMPKSVPLF